MRLKDRIALVTGAGCGFGEGIARRFAEEGAAVMVNDIDAAAAGRVAAAIRTAGGRAEPFVADVSRDADVASLVAATLGTLGGLDIVVNNAGTTHRSGPLLDVSEEEFDRVFAVNVKSLFLTARHVVPHFRARGGGAFVTVASTAGVRPRPGLVWYNGTKGAAIVISKSMAVELAPDRIRVNCVNPVIGETGLTERFMGAPDTPANRARFLAGIPLGRFSTPLEVANAALYLASDEAAFITGASIEVDGGRCI